jgi:putative aminopeptidase FrvX
MPHDTYSLLEQLCQVHSPAGEERAMKDFILEWVNRESPGWKTTPLIYEGPEWQDNLVLIFGKPRLAAFAHMDTTGFTVRYQNQLIPIGGPEVADGDRLRGKDSLSEIECKLILDPEYRMYYHFGRAIDRGTSLSFCPDFRHKGSYIFSPYLDNRAGIYNLLSIAPHLENGALVFSSWEEHGGGSVPYLVKMLYEKYQIRQMLISDITWVTDGVFHGQGVAISMRDQYIPRQAFIQKITEIAVKHNVKFQLEVEDSGTSDARDIQRSPYPIDWCFIGAPETNPHSALEKIHTTDLREMMKFYKILFKEL